MYHRLTNDVRRFLELTASASNEFFVPTLDIDLAWQYAGISHSVRELRTNRST